MTNEEQREPRHYVLEAETGSYRIEGGVANFVANSAAVANSALTSVGSSTTIVPRILPAGDAASRARAAIDVSSHFKLIFTVVVALTILAGVIELLLALLIKQPTHQQDQVFAAMDFAWKAGFGAIVGLLGGKVS